jgi:hypothetical protein
VILWISASQVARITGMSHQCQANGALFIIKGLYVVNLDGNFCLIVVIFNRIWSQEDIELNLPKEIFHSRTKLQIMFRPFEERQLSPNYAQI